MTGARGAVVIPAFNEEGTIRDIANRARKFCPVVIVVDDGSSDNTGAELVDSDVVVLRNAQNLGKAASLWNGMQHALAHGASHVITLDADGQHRPEDIPAILDAAAQHPDTIIIGARLHERQNIPAKRYLANRFANFWISWAAGYPIPDSQSGFRLYPASLIQDLNIDTGRERSFVFESEVLIEGAWRSVRSVPVPIPAIYGSELRKSHFRSLTDVKLITKMVARRLLQRHMHPRGFHEAFIRPVFRKLARRGFDRDAGAMFLLSGFSAIASLGTGYLWLLYRVIKTAWLAPTAIGPASMVVVPGFRLQNGNVSADYASRLNRAAEIAERNPEAFMLLLGGRPHGQITEAAAGKTYLVEKGVTAERIIVEETSANTLDNLRKARSLLVGQSGIAIVSNRYHLERIRTLANGLGLNVAACAAEGNRKFHTLLRYAIAEALFLHWYWVGRGYARLTRNDRILDKLL
ncbi:MAG: ElyC/SanA/YdcF family protein [Acidiferrobacteraceae bacterium]|jgi:uncharacterized SAM-binding protein YcdF (DUF218 family)